MAPQHMLKLQLARRHEARKRRQHTVLATAMACLTVLAALVPRIARTPYHTSAFTGLMWLNELLAGHPDRMYDALRIRAPVFNALVSFLRTEGIVGDSRFITLEEQLAIFLFICADGCGVRSAAERFQRGFGTIGYYYKRILYVLCGRLGSFYSTFVHIPTARSATDHILTSSPKFSPFFDNCIGFIDGSHLPAFVRAVDYARYRNRKGFMSQNVLAACTASLQFIYVMSGWEGSAADSRLWHTARQHDLFVPLGKFLLGDAGFPGCDVLMVPFRNVRYHLREWAACLDGRPKNAKELFNLRHASMRNAIERIFGIIKRRWPILTRPGNWSYDVQASVVPALCALHNFMRWQDPDELSRYLATMQAQERGSVAGAEGDELAFDDVFGISVDLSDYQPPTNTSAIPRAEKARAEHFRNEVAAAMWAQYQEELERRQNAGLEPLGVAELLAQADM